MRYAAIVILFYALLGSDASRADTDVYGPITESQTWTAAGSPYVVHGEVYVFPPATLTITEGVTVKFGPDPNCLLGPADDATMSFLGTADAPILFTSGAASPAPGDYVGIGVGSAVTARHCIVEFASEGIAVFGSPSFVDVTVRNCRYGLVVFTGAEIIDGVTSVDNVLDGAYGNELISATLRNCVFARNGRCGVNTNLESTSLRLDGCLVEENGLDGAVVTGNVRNSIIRSNGRYGLVSLTGWTVIEGNTIENNQLAEITFWEVPGYQTIECHDNNILDDDGLLLEVGNTCYVPGIDATGNYWGTTDVDEIAARIWDHNDDAGIPTVVLFKPFEDQVPTQGTTWSELKALFR